MKNKNQLILFGIVILIFAFGSIILNTQKEPDEKNISNDNAKGQSIKEIDSEPPIDSGDWVMSNITIDDNGGTIGALTWAEALAEPAGWCTGSGNWGEPYVIENVTIDAGGSGSGIFIRDSTVPFIIKNCTLYNGGTNGWDAGIRLENVSNGTIFNNTCSNNQMNGITLINSCENCTIENNIIQDNDDKGIILNNQCYNVTILNNTIGETPTGQAQNYGISIQAQSHDTIVENNTIFGHITNGIEIDDSKCQIVNNTIYQNSLNGIYVTHIDSSGTEVINNTIRDSNTYGIHIRNSANFVIVRGNSIKDINQYGINLHNVISPTLSDNEMINCGVVVFGFQVSTFTIYRNNTVNGNPVYFYKNQNGLVKSDFMTDGKPGQIILASCQDSEIRDFNISRSSVGIELCDSENITIRNVTAKYNTLAGIYLITFSNKNNIYNNTVSLNVERGIWLYYNCNENNITENTAENQQYGIILTTSSNYNNVTYNTVKSNNYGISIDGSNRNLILNNTANGNNDYGIYLQDNAVGNEIINNTIYDNDDYGIYLITDCDDNFIFNNDIRETGAPLTQARGIFLETDCGNNTIYKNEIYDHTSSGILLDNADDNKIFSNIIMGNSEGIYIDNSHRSIIKNNTVQNNGGEGIYLWMSNYTLIWNNTVQNNDVEGIFLDTECCHNRIWNNTVNSNGADGIFIQGDGYYNRIWNNTVSDNAGSGIKIDACKYNIILDNIVIDTPAPYQGTVGIYITSIADHNNISGNTIYGFNSGTYRGIRISTSKFNNISDNTIFDNYYGIYLEGFLSGSYNNTIHNNLVIDNIECNIWLDDNAYWNYITENTCNNSKYGIWLYDNCDHNYIIGNTIGNNTVIGAYLDDTEADNCKNNYFYKNEFRNNTIHAVDDMDVGINYWYDPIDKIGNFWDNYTGSDPNDDGIGNIPYNITGEGNRQDLYPICWDGQDVFPGGPAPPAAGDDDDDDEEDTGVVVVVVVIVVLACIGAGAVVVFILIKKQIIDLSKLKRKT